MADLFASGWLVDAILILVVLEIIALTFYWHAKRRGIAIMDLLPNVLAGGFLLLTLRLVLGGFNWMPCCASLAAAGVAHVVDLARRWKS